MKFNLNNIEKKNGHIKKYIYKCFSILVYLLIFTILIYVFISEITNLKIAGYEAFVIVSDSMEPQINKGDIVIIKNVPEKNINEGDVITFKNKGEYITHRIIKIEKNNGKNLYLYKGDKNEVQDIDKIEYSQIKGIQIGKIPLIGKLVIKASNQNNSIVLLIISILILLYRRAKKINDKRKGRRKKKKIEDERYFQNQKDN